MTTALTCACCAMWRVESYPLAIADDGEVLRQGMKVTHNNRDVAVCRTVEEVARVVPPAVFATLEPAGRRRRR